MNFVERERRCFSSFIFGKCDRSKVHSRLPLVPEPSFPSQSPVSALAEGQAQSGSHGSTSFYKSCAPVNMLCSLLATGFTSVGEEDLEIAQ